MNTYFKKRQINIAKVISMLFMIGVLTFIFATPVYATETNNTGNVDSELPQGEQESEANGTIPFLDGIDLLTNEDGETASATLQILFIITIISLAPSILIMLTSFTRIIIVLHFTRSALGTMSTPPNQILIGLALFLTFFIMSPVFMEVNSTAIQPLSRNEIGTEEAIELAIKPVRTFMLGQTNRKDLQLFLNIAEIDLQITDSEYPADDIPITVVIPSFLISELRSAFIMGFLIYIPFIIIDMVVASTLMSMGMMMLPPTTISMPFKILLFIIADGWNLIIGRIVETF